MEVGVGYPMLSTRTFNDRDLDTKATFAFGAARNRPGRKSIGGALLWDFGDSGDFGGMELRVRDWIDTSNVAVEWSVGYARPELRVARGAGFTTGRLHGVRGGAAVTICPYVTTFVRGELARANGKNRGALFGGAGFTSHASYISVLSAALGVGVLLLVAPPVS